MIDSFCFADSEWMHRTDTAAVGCLGERMKRKRVPLALLQMFASLKITGGQGKVKKKLFCGNTVEVLQFLSTLANSYINMPCCALMQSATPVHIFS